MQAEAQYSVKQTNPFIVIAYSLRHYNPEKPDFVWGSAGQIAQNIYLACVEEVGRNNVLMVDAIDVTSWKTVDQDVDFLFTIENNAVAAKTYFKPKKTMFISVNHNHISRRKIRKDLFSRNLSVSALDTSDGIQEKGEGALVADKILQIGNFEALSSFLQTGTQLRDIFPVAYKPKNFIWIPREPSNDILCHMGSIGFRKGADLIVDLIRLLNSNSSEIKIHLTGLPVNQYWSHQIDELKTKYPKNFTHHGWVDPHSLDFRELLGMCSTAIFPTREEGLSGAYLEVALSGLPTITTKYVGIETNPNLVFDIDGSDSLHEKIQERFSNFHTYNEIAGSVASIYSSLCLKSDQIRDSVKRFLRTETIWPSTNIIIPVHNKEKTIRNLLVSVRRACAHIDNVSLTLINDGSSDLSQTELENFIQNNKTRAVFQSVSLLETEDIFEVRSNNIGIQNYSSDYHIVIQDDNIILNPLLLAEMIALANKYQNIGAVGGLAGVNFFPIESVCEIHRPGQHACNPYEHYWRQDAQTDSKYSNEYFEVDAVMRGPLLLSSLALSEVGLFDERYAPLYSDDMAWCFKARSLGYRIVALTGGVLNQSESMRSPSQAQSTIYAEAYEKNTKLFYKEWQPKATEKHGRLARIEWTERRSVLQKLATPFQVLSTFNRKTVSAFLKVNYPEFSRKISRILYFYRLVKSQFSS